MADDKEKRRKQFSSGMGMTFLGSGWPSAGSGFGDRMIGDNLADQVPTSFRLAPRTYQLLHADDVPQLAVTTVGIIAQLPLDLLFHEKASTSNRWRQCWLSSRSSDWQWQLVVEPQGECVAATLVATPVDSARSATPLIWRPTATWQPFGRNAFQLEPLAFGSVPLIVRAL